LKLKYDELLSNVAFNLNLRRYNLARALRLDPDSVDVKADVRRERLKLAGPRARRVIHPGTSCVHW